MCYNTDSYGRWGMLVWVCEDVYLIMEIKPTTQLRIDGIKSNDGDTVNLPHQPTLHNWPWMRGMCVYWWIYLKLIYIYIVLIEMRWDEKALIFSLLRYSFLRCIPYQYCTNRAHSALLIINCIICIIKWLI